MKKITCWYMQNKDGSWSYNHFSDDWHADIYPRTKNKIQRENWKKHKSITPAQRFALEAGACESKL